MSYRLKFLPSALKEWKKLDNSLQPQLKKNLLSDLKIHELFLLNFRDLKITTKSN